MSYNEDLLRKNMISRNPQLKEEQDYVASLHRISMKVVKEAHRKSEKISFHFRAPEASKILFPSEAILLHTLKTETQDYMDRFRDTSYYLYISNGFFYYEKFTRIESHDHWDAELTSEFMYDINSKVLYYLHKKRFYGKPQHKDEYRICPQSDLQQANYLSQIYELIELKKRADIVSENQTKIYNIRKSLPDNPDKLYFYKKKLEFIVPVFLFFFLCITMMAIIVPFQISFLTFLIATIYKESINVKREKIIRNVNRIQKDKSIRLPAISQKNWLEEIPETCEIVVKDFIKFFSDIY